MYEDESSFSCNKYCSVTPLGYQYISQVTKSLSLQIFTNIYCVCNNSPPANSPVCWRQWLCRSVGLWVIFQLFKHLQKCKDIYKSWNENLTILQNKEQQNCSSPIPCSSSRSNTHVMLSRRNIQAQQVIRNNLLYFL